MGARGRQSAADAEIPGVVQEAEYLEPSPRMTMEQRKIWNDAVHSKPPEWFGEETRPLMEVYCQAISSHRKMKKRLEAIPDDIGVMEYQRLMKMEATHAQLIVSLSTRMRLTQQSKYDHKKAHRIERDYDEDKPWNE